MVAGVFEGSPYTTYKQLMDEAKAKPRTVIWGGNIGSANHMAIAAMERGTPGAEFKKVQIGGAAESYAGLKGKIINVGNFGIGEIVAYRGAGLKPLAVLSEARDPAIPDVPTAKELGYDAVFCNEHNLYAPKGTPAGAHRRPGASLHEGAEHGVREEGIQGEAGRDHPGPHGQGTAGAPRGRSREVPADDDEHEAELNRVRGLRR